MKRRVYRQIDTKAAQGAKYDVYIGRGPGDTVPTTAVNIRDVAREELESGEVVYVGRQRPAFMWAGGYYLPRSDWHNPFKVGNGTTAEEGCAKFERYLFEERPDLIARLPELRGKKLACWCALGEACHAKSLSRLADAPLGQRN